MDVQSLLEKYKLQLGIFLVGLIFLGVSLILYFIGQEESPSIQIISEEETVGQTVFVDLEGAVQNPGVFELPKDSRFNDLLIRAGGLSAEADREWVARKVNLAQKLEDGMKIYIQKKGEVLGSPAIESVQVASTETKINLNTASADQLDSLWGIGEKRAQDIIANRPYQSVEDLVSRKIIPQNVYLKIKTEITVE